MTGKRQLQNLAACVLCAAALGGCAAAGGAKPAMASQAPPHSPAQAADEIRQLEQRIAQSRRALGLPVRSKPAGSGERAFKAQAGGQASDEAPEAVPPPPAPARTALAPSSDHSTRTEAPDPCRHTKAICAAAERICSLADYLREADARTRCTQAREDCEEAKRSTGCD